MKEEGLKELASLTFLVIVEDTPAGLDISAGSNTSAGLHKLVSPAQHILPLFVSHGCCCCYYPLL